MKLGLVNFGSLRFHVTTPFTQPLGGSESSLCYLATKLAQRGHQVILYGQYSSEFTLKHVLHRHQRRLETPASEKLDHLIIQNYVAINPLLGESPHPTRLILWQQHHTDQPATSLLARPDIQKKFAKFVFVSHWQMKNFQTQYHLDPQKCQVLKNAVSPHFARLFPPPAPILKHKHPVIVYTSAPFRGLETLLFHLFPEIQKRFPTVILKVFSSLQTYQRTAAAEKTYHQLYDYCHHTPGIEYLGSLAQPQLARQLKSAIALTYPNTWYETSCIAAMEAMAAGCQVITTAQGALPETTAGFAHLIPTTPRYHHNRQLFVNATVATLTQLTNRDPVLETHLQKQIAFCHQNYTWDKRASEWESLLSSLT